MADADYLSKLLMDMQRRLETLERRKSDGGGGGGGITIDDVYPVGSIYLSVNSTNPSSIFGGTWVEWGSGKVPVGVDTNDTDFDNVEETGGGKTHQHVYGIELASEYYMVGIENCPKTGAMQNGTGDGTGFTRNGETVATQLNKSYIASGTPVTVYYTKSTANTSATSSLQPYITCYMWKRTA